MSDPLTAGRQEWIRFVEWVDEVIHLSKSARFRYYFRGHQDRHHTDEMKPKIGRLETGFPYKPIGERKLLEAFKRRARLIEQGVDFTDFDWLAMGAHYGLPTRLLDWSENPFVAAFFAVTGIESGAPPPDPNADGEIVAAMFKSPRWHVFQKEEDIFREREEHFDVILLEPSHRVARITAQQGIFSMHCDPAASFTLAHDAVEDSRRYAIPAAVKGEFRTRLFKLGFDHASVSRDLDGLAKAMQWRYVAGEIQ
jgi:hypothetical protein